jgi:hypothetical protein
MAYGASTRSPAISTTSRSISAFSGSGGDASLKTGTPSISLVLDQVERRAKAYR